MPMYLMFTSLRGEGGEKTHTDMKRAYKLHTDSDPSWGSILFFSSTLSQHDTEKTMLFEDMLYQVSVNRGFRVFL